MTQLQRQLRYVIVVMASGIWTAPSAFAFDCRKAGTPSEKAICADPELKKLDAQLNRDYAAFRAHYQKSGKYDCLVEDETKEQKEWLRKRSACGADKQCIRSAYENRLQNLNKYTGLCYPQDSSFVHAGRSCYEPTPPTAPVASTTSPTAPTASTQSSQCERISSASVVPKNEDKKAKSERQKTERAEILAYNKVYFVPSDSGLQAMALHEGIAHCLYNDQAGLATIGIGHLIEPRGSITQMPTKVPDKFEEYRHGISNKKMEDIKRADIGKTVKRIADKRIKVKLNACQTDALISFFYNVGAGWPSVYSLLNSCDFSGVAAKMKEFNKVTINGKKVVSAGLAKRREEEAAMFLHCQYPSGTPGVVPCCTYKLEKTFPKVSPGEYQAKCKKDCSKGGACYGI